MKGIKVLVIDDESAILRLLALALSEKGYHVDTADNGELGIEMVKSNQYHLVLTDMQMGNVSGEDVLRQARLLKGDCLPVIAMSGTPWLMENLPFDAVLPKPYSLKMLLEMMQNFSYR
jgi:DNA-binding response OmpR family regulator